MHRKKHSMSLLQLDGLNPLPVKGCYGRPADVDRLSSLPDSVLLHILTFLPVKDAVKTALIAPRFRHLWAFLPILSFDFCSYHNCKTKTYNNGPEYSEDFLSFVYSLLLLHQGETIDKFHLKLELNFCHTMGTCDPSPKEFVVKEKRMADAVTTWVLSAMRKNVKVLHLDFIGCGLSELGAYYRLPKDVFSGGECLRELNLSACEIKLGAQIQLRSLKKLILDEVGLDDNTMDQILCGCSVLEELSLLDCNGLSRLAFRNPSVKSLEITVWCKSRRLEISCPNVVSLHLLGKVCYVDLVDVSSVACAALLHDIRWESELSECLKVKTLFEKLRHCKNFRSCSRSILVFNILQNILQLPDLSFEWKYLELKLIQKEFHHPGISYLLRSSPLLETLDMRICRKWPDKFKCDEAPLLQAQYLDNGEFWSSQEGTFHCLQHHLKTVRIYGDVTEPHVIEFIEFLLKNAMVLEKLVVSAFRPFQPTKRSLSRAIAHRKYAFSTEKRLEICQKLCILPRASSSAMIIFS